MIDRYDLEANPMDFPTKAAKKPDIHLLIAAGMKDGDPKKAAQQLFIRCDGGNCAASPVSGGVSASYPTGSGSYHQIQVARKNGHFDIFKWYIEK